MRKRLTIYLILSVFPCVASSTPVNTPPVQSISEEKAFHLLNRMSFGPRPGEVESLAQAGDQGIEAWIKQQLNPETLVDTEVENKIKAFKTLSMSIAELHEAIARPKQAKLAKEDNEETLAKMDKTQRPRRILLELISQKLIRSVESKKQFQEVMVDFWFNHFNVDFSKGQVKWYVTSYERDVIRRNVFGKFRDLLGAVAKSPAMLFYLDNFQSFRDGFTRPGFLNGVDGVPKKLGLNENYGRELLELHTLGVDGGYTQNDVRETARALTGWSLDQPLRDTEFKFRKRTHDEGEKHILKLELQPGGGIEDGEKVLDMLASHPSTARFIVRKLAIKFISDHPPDSAIQKLAATFQKTGGDLRAVYAELFHLPEFWAPEARRSKIKTPWEFEVSAARSLGSTVQIPERGPLRTFMSLEQMGEPLYRCQPPTGFKATSEYWVNPGALVARINYGLALAADRIPEIDVDLPYFRKRLDAKPTDSLESSIETLNRLILAGELRPDTRARLVSELDSEEKVMAEGDEHRTALNLRKLIGLVLGSPEFQRR